MDLSKKKNHNLPNARLSIFVQGGIEKLDSLHATNSRQSDVASFQGNSVNIKILAILVLQQENGIYNYFKFYVTQ